MAIKVITGIFFPPDIKNVFSFNIRSSAVENGSLMVIHPSETKQKRQPLEHKVRQGLRAQKWSGKTGENNQGQE